MYFALKSKFTLEYMAKAHLYDNEFCNDCQLFDIFAVLSNIRSLQHKFLSKYVWLKHFHLYS